MNILMDGIEGKITTLEQADLGINFIPFRDKGEDIHDWLRVFEACCEFRSYDDVKCIKALKMLVRGSAATYYDGIQAEVKREVGNDDAALLKGLKEKLIIGYRNI